MTIAISDDYAEVIASRYAEANIKVLQLRRILKEITDLVHECDPSIDTERLVIAAELGAIRLIAISIERSANSSIARAHG